MKVKSKYTQKELKKLVAIGAAKDISNGGRDMIPGRVEIIGRSFGVNGVTGKLARNETGELFVAFGSAIYTLPI